MLLARYIERYLQRLDALLQYGEGVWGIRTGTDDERITAAIAQTRDFFERIGIATRLRDYGLGAEAIDTIVQQLQDHGMTQLCEHGDISPAISRRILEAAL